MARARGEGHEEYDAPRRQKPPPPQTFFQLFDEEDAEKGSRPPCLGEPRGPQDRVQQRTVEQLADVVPMVQILDIPGLQGVDQLVEACRHLDLHIPEQAIEVPKISSSSSRCRRSRVPVVQTAEQLVEVPTITSYSSFLQRTVEQTIDIPVPHDRGGRGGGTGLQGFSQGQGTTARSGAEFVNIPVPGLGGESSRGGLQGSRARQNSIARAVEQNVEIPARRGLQSFPPGQGSSASSSSRLHDGADDGIQGFFGLFPGTKKVRRHPPV